MLYYIAAAAANEKDFKGHPGGQSGQQHGTPDRTGRTPVHQRRGEFQPEPVQPQVDADV